MIESANHREKLATLLQASPLAIVELDRTGIVTMWSAAAERIYGWSATEAIGRHYAELVVPDDERANFEAVHAQALAGAVTEREATRLRKDGTLVEVSSSIVALRDDRGEPSGVLLMIADITGRIQAERALQKAHDELQLTTDHIQTLIDNIYDLILIISKEGRIQYASTSIERVTGYAAAGILNADAFEYVHPDDLEKIQKVQRFLLIHPGDTARTSGRFRHQNGHWIELAITAHFAPRLSGIVVNARDETWRAQADAALKAGERKFRSIVEHIDDGVALIDESGAVIEWNRGMERIAGLTRDDVLGRFIWDVQFDLIPAERKTPDALEQLRDLVRGILLTGLAPLKSGQVEETLLQRPDGARRFVEARLTPVATDRGFIVVSILRDVTERQQADERLKQQERYFRTLIENASDIISVLAPLTGEIVFESPSVERILGYVPKEIVGQNMLDYVHPDDLAGIMTTFGVLADRPGLTATAEARFRHKDGSWRSLEVIGRHVPELGGIVVNSRDVTERKQLEEDLERRVAECTAELAQQREQMQANLFRA